MARRDQTPRELCRIRWTIEGRFVVDVAVASEGSDDGDSDDEDTRVLSG